MEKTVKQLADEYGLSKQAINYRIKKLSKECINFDSKGTKLINEKGLKILDEMLSKDHQKVGSKFDSKIDTSTQALIEQLAIKDKQIEELMKSLQFEQAKNRELEDKVLLIESKELEQERAKTWIDKLLRK